MEPSVPALTLDELKLVIREALRETLYLAFDQLDSGDEVSLAAFADLLARAAADESAEPVSSKAVREVVTETAYAVISPSQLADLTSAGLARFVAGVVRETLPALLNDPDWGLELREDLADLLDQGSSGDPPLPLRR